ncbi:MAG: DUF1269 domain-containing protein [Anaerolineae bacterium]|nr:DUF1269 domain-containing protein [Anaerolineae bacterium]
MATLTVLKFESAGGAETMLETLKGLTKQELIKLHDAAIVTWPEGKKKPKTRQLVNLAGAGALSGAFWGMLFGLLFFVPLFGMAVGAAMGALSGSFADFGIDDDFIKSVREKVTEGTSALFLLTSDAVLDRVKEAVKDQKFEIIGSNLSLEEESKLREMFADEEEA